MISFKKLALFYFTTISFLFADFKTISTKEVEILIKKNIPIIDIRTHKEFSEFGIIENSYKLTFFDTYGNYNIDIWMDKFTKIIKNKNQPFILVCAHANRTKILGELLSKEYGYKNVYELDGGIKHGWIYKKNKVVK